MSRGASRPDALDAVVDHKVPGMAREDLEALAAQRRPAEAAGVPNGSSVNVGKLLTAEDVSERWQVPVAQVYRLTRDGRVPAVKLGRYYRYRLAALEEWEAGGGAGA